jgi:hypothetical protein
MYSTLSVALVVAALVLAIPATAAEAQKSLAERRLEVIKGTNEGRKILDLGSARSNDSAASAPSPQKSGSSAPAPSINESKTEKKSSLFGKLPPPSGKSIATARRTEGPGIGIAVPSTAAASQAAPGK